MGETARQGSIDAEMLAAGEHALCAQLLHASVYAVGSGGGGYSESGLRACNEAEVCS